jgi:rhodanese-related sulfurtransferase
MTSRSVSPETAWDESRATGRPILDLRSRAERRRFGRPPGSVKVSLFRHALMPASGAIYLCQHAVRSKVPAARGGKEVEGGFVAWQAAGLPVEVCWRRR